jgi:hypothetical protein
MGLVKDAHFSLGDHDGICISNKALSGYYGLGKNRKRHHEERISNSHHGSLGLLGVGDGAAKGDEAPG